MEAHSFEWSVAGIHWPIVRLDGSGPFEWVSELSGGWEVERLGFERLDNAIQPEVTPERLAEINYFVFADRLHSIPRLTIDSRVIVP